MSEQDQQEGGSEDRGPIPFAKFESVRKQAQTYRAELDALRTEREALAARVAELEPLGSRVAELEPLAGQLGSAREALDLARMGVHDDDVIEAIRAVHRRAGGEAPLVDWVRAQREAGDAAHPVVRSLLPGAAAATTPPAQVARPSGAVPPASGAVVQPVSLEAAIEAARKGDPTQFAALEQLATSQLAQTWKRR